MKYKILLSLLVVSVLACSVADAQYSRQEKKPTIADDVQEHLDYWKPVWEPVKYVFFSVPAFIIYGAVGLFFIFTYAMALGEHHKELEEKEKNSLKGEELSDEYPVDDIPF